MILKLNDGDVLNSYLADHKCVNREEAYHQRLKNLVPRIKFYTESNCKMVQRYAVMRQSTDCTPLNLVNFSNIYILNISRFKNISKLPN